MRPHPSLDSARSALALVLATAMACVHSPSATAQTRPTGKPPQSAAPTRVAILNFGPPREWNGLVQDGLGTVIDPAAWREAIPLLEQDRVDVVVIHVHSGGGEGAASVQFAALFEKEFKPRFRTVAWVHCAVGEAAISILPVEEWAMPRDGFLGTSGCHFGGCPPPETGASLARRVADAQLFAMKGKHSEFLARALVIQEPLSADTDGPEGAVVWHGDETGRTVLNRAGMPVSINASEGARTRLTVCTASTREELARGLGIKSVAWEGSAAAAHVDESMRHLDTAQKTLIADHGKYKAALGAADAKDAARPSAGALATARTLLERMRSTAEAHPAMLRSICVAPEWFDEQKSQLDKFSRPAEPPPSPAPATPPTPAPDPAPPKKAVPRPRIAILNLGPPADWNGAVGDHVGVEVDPAIWPDAARLLEADGVQVVVVHVRCGGGNLLAVESFLHVVQDELKPRFRTVAWIDAALDEASLCVLPFDEICFRSGGRVDRYLGSGWGCGKSDPVLWARRFAIGASGARMGHRDRAISDALMSMGAELSYDLSRVGGGVHWRSDSAGQHVVFGCPTGERCSFEAAEALHSGFAVAIADSREELACALGLHDAVWCGKAASELVDASMRSRDREIKAIHNAEGRLVFTSEFPKAFPRDSRSPALLVEAKELLVRLKVAFDSDTEVAEAAGISAYWLKDQQSQVDRLTRKVARMHPTSSSQAPSPDPSPPSPPAPAHP